MQIHTELLGQSLVVMGEGMFGIFLFMLIFYGIIAGFNKMDSKYNKSKDA